MLCLIQKLIIDPNSVASENSQMAMPWEYILATIIGGIESGTRITVSIVEFSTSPLLFCKDIIVTQNVTESLDNLKGNVVSSGNNLLYGVVGAVATPLIPVASLIGYGASFVKNTFPRNYEEDY